MKNLKNNSDLRKEISDLKRDLNELNVQKEKWFSIKESLSEEIRSLIKSIRNIKSTKDKSSESIKSLKEQRDKYNKQTQELIVEFKKLNSEKHKIMKENKIDFDPSKILDNINKLEQKIETEALSFKKEQQYMKQIRGFKKKLHESEGVQETFRNLKSLSGKIKESKDLAESFHKRMQDEYKKSKEGYGDFISLTKQINDLNKKQEEAFKKFIESKNKFSKINDGLKGKLKHASKFAVGEKIKRQIKENAVLEEKAKEVETKIKEKKKLTTDDLLVFQKDDKK
jgi:phosphoserine phosphatase